MGILNSLQGLFPGAKTAEATEEKRLDAIKKQQEQERKEQERKKQIENDEAEKQHQMKIEQEKNEAIRKKVGKALQANNKSLAGQILEENPDFDINYAEKGEETLLAQFCTNEEIAEFLLEVGAHADGSNHKGEPCYRVNTPLYKVLTTDDWYVYPKTACDLIKHGGVTEGLKDANIMRRVAVCVENDLLCDLMEHGVKPSRFDDLTRYIGTLTRGGVGVTKENAQKTTDETAKKVIGLFIDSGAELDINQLSSSIFEQNPKYLIMYNQVMAAKHNPERVNLQEASRKLWDDLTLDAWIFKRDEILNLIDKGAVTPEFKKNEKEFYERRNPPRKSEKEFYERRNHSSSESNPSHQDDLNRNFYWDRLAFCAESEILQKLIKAGAEPTENTLATYMGVLTRGGVGCTEEKARTTTDETARETIKLLLDAGNVITTEQRKALMGEIDYKTGETAGVSKYLKMYDELYAEKQKTARHDMLVSAARKRGSQKKL